MLSASKLPGVRLANLEQRWHRQRGASLIQTLVAMLVFSLLLASFARERIQTATLQAGEAQGSSLAEINKALGLYITATANSQALRSGSAIAGVANPMSPTLSELQALGFLSANMNTSPANGGSFQASVVLLPAGCSGLNCNIATRLWMSNPLVDGLSGKTDIVRLGALVARLGGNAGFSDSSSPTLIRGTGGWTLPNPDPSGRAGIVLAINGYGSTVDANYVRVRDTRDPDLQGNLTAQGNIVAQGYLGLGNPVVSQGAGCTGAQLGFIAKTSTNAVMICNGLTWQNIAGSDRVVNIGEACAIGEVARDTSGIILSCQGGIFKNASGFPTNVTSGAACSPSGAFGMDSSGLSYLCRGGVWTAQVKLSPSAVEMSRMIVTDGAAAIPKPACATGGVGTFDITPLSISLDLTTAPPYSALEYGATDNGSSWSPRIWLRNPSGTTQSGNTLSITALMRIFCTYPL